MGKLTLSSLAITLIILGAAVISGHPAWGTITGIAILLVAVATGAGALPIESLSEDYALERKVAGKKISNGLVTLSSAAILAVYVAGYHRTSSAAAKFEAQTARRRTAAPNASSFVAPTAALPKTGETPASPHPVIRPGKDNPRNSSTASRRTPPARPPIVNSQATASDSPAAATTPGRTNEPTAPATAMITTDIIAEPSALSGAAGKIQFKDGTYTGTGQSRHGGMEVVVVIQNGEILSATIDSCWTRYSCHVIDQLPGRVINNQSTKVDFVSGATDSCDAFLDAVAEALSRSNE